VRLLPVTQDQYEFVQQVATQMQQAGIRVKADLSGERLGKLIRNAEKQKVPVMAVVGAKEVEANSLSVRTRASGELGSMEVGEVMEKLQSAIAQYENF
jgi:threonyl-tRNA synthetase